MLLNIKPKLYLKFILKGSKTIKIMKGSNNKMGLTHIKAIFSVYKLTRNIDILGQ